ncbi:hypothetical protein CHH28_10950 [Bacterioplanes sanyensis]|uniref:Uncharacterized protein n=1 Tax=Bacterioplanes sanyensis TaxID=1249553 RepID=A0A222FLR2_9GAMM|nr:hypothetical protein [Bacterioplanes sanyensis]ASP39163.1 hypothetical protein CHH28_10950 [Bacterioplanes sanyensis]
MLAEAGSVDSYSLDDYSEQSGESAAGVWLAVHRVDAITDLGARGREVSQVWHSSTLQVREHNGGYQIARCDVEGGWHDWTSTQDAIALPLFFGAGQHPKFRYHSNSRFDGITLDDLTADEGPQRRPVHFANQHSQMIRIASARPSLGQVEQQINQLSLNQPVQCFTRRMERRLQQGCGQAAQVDLHSISLIATGEQGSSTLAVSLLDEQYAVVSTINSEGDSRNGLTASQPDIIRTTVSPLQAQLTTQFEGTNVNQGQSSVSMTLNIDVPL